MVDPVFPDLAPSCPPPSDHMTGFTLWDTAAHNYSMAHTAYKGGGQDVVRDFVASCKKYGVRPGYFYSLHFNWFLGVDNFKVGHPPLGPNAYTQEEYLAIAEVQLRELFGAGFGTAAAELWFDGGTGPSNGTAAKVVREVAPRAICHSCEPFTQNPANASEGYGVRWMGNEGARMPLPSWGASTGGQSGAYNGDPRGLTFQPPSCDAVLREHYWFWQPQTEQYAKSTKALVNNYLTSVGRAANLILNIAPDDSGAVPASDVLRYAEMGAAIECLFGSPVGGTVGGVKMVPTSAGNGADLKAQGRASRACVLHPPPHSRTHCATACPLHPFTPFTHALTSGGHYAVLHHHTGGGTMEWLFPDGPLNSSNMSLVLMEDQTAGQLVNEWSLDCLSAPAAGPAPADGGADNSADSSVDGSTGISQRSSPVYSPCTFAALQKRVIPATPGPGVGHKRILRLENTERAQITGMRMNVHSHFAQPGQTPVLRSVQVFDWETKGGCV
jgi:hypothetical protein